MDLKAWAYLAASIGLGVGIYLFRKKHNKYGFWIFLFSLMTFFGGNLNIDKFSLISGTAEKINVELGRTQERIDAVEVQLKQAISLKQEVTQTVNVITEVKKEITNIKEATDQLYAAYKEDVFKKRDLGKRMMVKPSPIDPKFQSLLLFELQDIPIVNSVQIIDNHGRFITTFEVISNCIALRRSIIDPDTFMTDVNDFYQIRYIPYELQDQKMATIKDADIQIVNDVIRYQFFPKDYSSK